MESLWGGRFEKDMDEIVKRYNASIFFDQRMYNEDIDGSVAHVTMLAKQGIVTEAERDQIIAGLEGIRADIAAGKITFTVEDGVLKRAIGTHLPNSSATPAAGEEPLSALSALTAFRNTIREGAVGTAVTDVYLCYELQSTTTALMTLVPAWCVVTDTAVYYVNCITAVVTPA